TTPRQHVASSLDGHPSGHTHSLAARRIVNEINQLKFFPSREVAIDISEETWRLTEAMRNQGRSPEECLKWSRRVLNTKKLAWRRQISKPEGIVLGDSSAVEGRIEAGCQRWRQRIALNGWARTLGNAERDKLWRFLQNFSGRQRDLDELLYCAGADEKNVAT